MSPQSLGISGASEEDTHKLRLTVAEMRRDAALLEQRVRAAEVDDDGCPCIPFLSAFFLLSVFLNAKFCFIFITICCEVSSSCRHFSLNRFAFADCAPVFRRKVSREER